MVHHIWKDLGLAPNWEPEHLWKCDRCESIISGGDEPWIEKGFPRMVTTGLTCGMGPGAVDELIDCDQEIIRKILIQ